MPLDRDPLARQRSAVETSDFRDERGSLFPIFLSVMAFGAGEFFTELNIDSLPGGLVFPLGFILFWAFYYTYYRPNVLEDHLRPMSELNFPNVFGLVFGTMVWFVKVTVVGLFDLLFVRWWNRSKATPKEKAKSEAKFSGAWSGQTGSFSYKKPSPSQSAPKSAVPESLPQELQVALGQLGIDGGNPPWDVIHKRYRELAKRYHPDLAQDITLAGNRFIKIDQAFRKLSTGKGKYFR